METAKMIIDRDYTLSSTDENLFCSFVEPLGRCIYGGLYEPGHPSADEKGFRRDVLELIKPLNLTMNRFPGGNYTSTFRWEDSVGPKEKRPHRAEVAWQCNVRPRTGAADIEDGIFCADLEPLSWNVIRLRRQP